MHHLLEPTNFRKWLAAILALACGLLGGMAFVYAAGAAVSSGTLTVDTLIDEVDGSCSDGDCSLRDAIAVAGEGDTILFDAGVAGGTIYLEDTLEISKSLNIDGQGRDITLSGDTGGDGTPDVRVIYITGTLEINLSYLTIADGLGLENETCGQTGSGSRDCGGGMLIEAGAVVTVSQSTISGCQTTVQGYGAGIYNSGVLEVISSTIDHNWSGYGGGIFSNSFLEVYTSTLDGNLAQYEGAGIINLGQLEIFGSTIRSNQVQGWGGGIYNSGAAKIVDAAIEENEGMGEFSRAGGIYNDGSLTVMGSQIVQNRAPLGGGIYNFANALTIVDSLISDNQSAAGGGIMNECGIMLISHSDIRLNTATLYDGGGIYSYDTGSQLLLEYSNISENVAVGDGGGVYSADRLMIRNSALNSNQARNGGALYEKYIGDGSVHSSTISGNQAEKGGGIYLEIGRLHVYDSTIVGNSGSVKGGGISFSSDWNVFYVFNTIIASNLVGGDCDILLTFSLNSHFGDATCDGMADGDPLLGPLADNGGPTLTHKPLSESPVIDGGGNTCLGLDQRGLPRPQDGDGDGTTACDIGAFEAGWMEVSSNQTLKQKAVDPEEKDSPEAILVVDTLVDESDGSCLDGDCSLRDAIQAAEDGDTIQFDAGIAGGTIYLESTLVISKNLTIDGQNNGITISGDSGADGSPDTNVFIVSDYQKVTFNGLTISDGYGVPRFECDYYTGQYTCGGGIIIGLQAYVTVTHCTLRNNYARSGGAIYGYWIGQLIVSNSVLSNNRAEAGGAISGLGGMVLTDSTLRNNQAERGGAILVNGPLLVQNCAILDNTAGEAGGGIESSDIVVVNSVISGNQAENGGGIKNWNILSIQDSTIQGNHASNFGGGVLNQYGMVVIEASTLRNNTVSQKGGGILTGNDHSILKLENSNLSGNQAGQGGGFYLGNSMAVAMMQNSTLAGNQASNGGGVYADQPGGQRSGFTSLHLLNTIISNSPLGGDCVFSLGGTPKINLNNLIEDGSCNPQFSGDPQLEPLAFNGGPTWTHALPQSSPAVDAGDNRFCPLTDQRGSLRPFDGDGDGLAACDLGAYEYSVRKASQITITSHLPEPSLIGQAVTIHFEVEAVEGGMEEPEGYVTVNDGMGDYCIGSVEEGQCSLIPTSAGVLTLTARYGGDLLFEASLDEETHQVDYMLLLPIVMR